MFMVAGSFKKTSVSALDRLQACRVNLKKKIGNTIFIWQVTDRRRQKEQRYVQNMQAANREMRE